MSDLLSQFDQEIDRFIADGIYDQGPVYAAVEDHSPEARAIISPRKNAALSPTAETSPTQRDEHLEAIERDGVFAWKRTSGYYAQSHAENAFARFKRAFGDGLHAKRDASQERETMIALQLAQSDAGIGPATVLSGELRASFKGVARGLFASCNNPFAK